MVSLSADAPLQHIRHTELASNLADIFILAFKLKCRRACCYLQSGDSGQVVNQLLCESVRKVSLVCLRAHIAKWEDRDRSLGGSRSVVVRSPHPVEARERRND